MTTNTLRGQESRQLTFYDRTRADVNENQTRTIMLEPVSTTDVRRLMANSSRFYQGRRRQSPHKLHWRGFSHTHTYCFDARLAELLIIGNN